MSTKKRTKRRVNEKTERERKNKWGLKRKRWKSVRRNEGGRKEVGLARAAKRVERTRSQPSEREREREREMQREVEKVGGRTGLGEWIGEESTPDLFSPGLCLRGSVEPFLLWKNFLFPSVSFLLCLFFFSLSSLHLPVFSFLSTLSVLSFITLFFHLYLPHTFGPDLRPSFDGLHSLLSSSRLIQPLFSQDASLQVLLHQNGTETEIGSWESCSGTAVFWEQTLLSLSVHILSLKVEQWQTAAGCFH